MLTIFLAISGTTLIHLIVWLMVIGLIFWLLWWLIGYLAIPEPFNKVVRVILVVAAVLFLINLLLGLAGNALIEF